MANGNDSLPWHDFEKNAEKIFQEFQPLAEKNGFEVTFRIRLHPFHNDSATVRDAVLAAIQRGAMHFEGRKHDIIKIDFTKSWAEQILNENSWGKLFRDFSPRIVAILLHES